MRVDEWFLDGHARLDLPMGTSEGPQVDQGANLALWAEAVWMPSVWITDPAATWEPIDDHTARLTVPFGAERERFTAAFDPDTGLLTRMESMRFKGEADEARTPWINEAFEWGEVDGAAVAPAHDGRVGRRGVAVGPHAHRAGPVQRAPGRLRAPVRAVRCRQSRAARPR